MSTDPPLVLKGQTLWITRQVRHPNTWDDTRKPSLHLSIPYTNFHGEGSEFFAQSLGRVYTCVYAIFCSGLLPRRPQCPGPGQVFSYLIDPSPGQGSDKRLIFLLANDLRIPDVLHLFLLPSLPLPPIALTNFASFVFSRCCASSRSLLTSTYIAKLPTHRKRSRARNDRSTLLSSQHQGDLTCPALPLVFLESEAHPERNQADGARRVHPPQLDHLLRENGVSLSCPVEDPPRREAEVQQLFSSLLISPAGNVKEHFENFVVYIS